MSRVGPRVTQEELSERARISVSFLSMIERGGPIRLLTLNRPAQRNALSPDLLGRLRAALQDADRDQTSRVVCITGAGDRAFCAGADLSSVAAGSALAAHEARRAYSGLLLDLSRLGKPVVA